MKADTHKSHTEINTQKEPHRTTTSKFYYYGLLDKKW